MRSCKVTEYYSILGVEKGCEDVHVKKAYRKVSRGKVATQEMVLTNSPPLLSSLL